MRITRRLATVAVATALVAGSALAAAPAATAAPTGPTSLATVLGNDLKPGNGFDKNWYDFDIVREAVDFVLASKPTSPVGVLADPTVELTAFIPNDRAFQVLAADLFKTWSWKEGDVFAKLGGLGADTIETVLLYHVVLGPPIDSATALKADGVARRPPWA